MRVLLVEDDSKLRNLLKTILIRNNFAVDTTDSAVKCEEMAIVNPYDAIVLDVILPDGDGFKVCKRLRENGVSSGVLMISVRGSVEKRIKGIDIGADDFLPKPFDIDEFISRVKGLVRRSFPNKGSCLKHGDITLNLLSYKVIRNNRVIALTHREFMVLEYLMRKAGYVVTREELIDHVWDQSYDSFSNIVDVFVHSLRKKLTTKGEYDPIETVRGIGYRLV